MTETLDAVVVGAGIVGLAVGRALAREGRDVVVLERHRAMGTETSSRNSEVIHAGIYYRPGGLRARLCAPGRAMLYDFCTEHKVAFERCGKLIVAHGQAEIAALARLKKIAERNGVDDLEMLDGRTACAKEPLLQCDAALYSPSTGIVDSHGLMTALLGDLEDAGGALALASPVHGGRIRDGGVEFSVGGAEPVRLLARQLVNCAGLSAPDLARAILPPTSAARVPTLYFGKGQYFTYQGAPPFSFLIYPAPTPDSQGAHYTRDLGGQAKLGPDLVYVSDADDFDVDESARDAFARSGRRYWPDLDADRLAPGYAGIRPKLAGPGEEGDFLITDHGAPSYLGLYGIESPGLTACLALADEVARRLSRTF